MDIKNIKEETRKDDTIDIQYKDCNDDNTQDNIKEFNSNILKIDINGLNDIQMEQIKKIRKIIENTLIYSLFFFNKARWWRKSYWITGITAIILTCLTSLINLIFDPCDNEEIIKIYNVVFSFSISIFLGIITLMDSSNRSDNFELAGDRYSMVAGDMFREVFYSNKNIYELDLYYIMQKYSAKLDIYHELYNEPPVKKISKLRKSPQFELRNHFRNVILI